MSRGRRGWWLLWASGCVLLVAMAEPARADTIRFKNGTTVEGQVIREDGTQVVIVVGGRAEFYSAAEVESIAYSQLRFVPPTTAAPSTERPLSAPASIDYTLVKKIGERLLAFHGVLRRYQDVLKDLRGRKHEAAFEEARQAAQWLLPTHDGLFSPFSALADLLILLGLRAPTVWLALLLVKEPRSFTHIVEFLVVAYGLVMGLMAFVLVAPSAWVRLLVLPLAMGGTAWLFVWLFALTPTRGLLALGLTLALNIGIEYVFLQARLI